MKALNSIDEIVFEERDTAIFKIVDTKTKLLTLQNYFFPRMERLLHYTLNIAADVYSLNPYEKTTFVYHPSHRQKANKNEDSGLVHIGVTAKRSTQPLKIIKRNRQPFYLHPTYLTFKVLSSGTIHVELLPFRQGVDDAYVAKIASLIKRHSDTLTPLLSLTHVSHRSDVSFCEFLPLHEAICPEEIGSCGIKLVSPKYYFPVDSNRGLYELILAFTFLYALVDSFVCIGEGQEPKLERMLEQFKEWYVKINTAEYKEAEEFNNTTSGIFELPELDSYSFIRAGKWWAVLARDKWKCLSCGRTAKENGVLLEVDHIVPRSKGGSDDMSNLQTLCKKCNIGKSNRDSTKLF